MVEYWVAKADEMELHQSLAFSPVPQLSDSSKNSKVFIYYSTRPLSST